jgi:NAD(P)-dependent dehydrogenase (short-subunit alcohol dehydrogenase family)
MSPRPLAGKVALVTGARGGLGAATAAALARLGTTIVASGRQAGDCEHVVEAIVAAGGTAADFVLDLARLDTLAAGAEQAYALYGRLDIVINNAGVIEPQALFGRFSGADFHAALGVNVSGPVALISTLWPRFVEQGGARIVNVSSGAATRPVLGWAAYCAGKAALLMATRSIELEGRPHGVRAFAFAPGLVDTPMQAAIRAAGINEVGEIPRARLAPPEEPARAIAFLASGAADDLAGTFLDIRQDEIRMRMQADQ